MDPGLASSTPSTADIELRNFENGIIAGDLDSLLEMFEEAENVLSSSVGCISLTQNTTSDQPAEKNLDSAAGWICVSSPASLPDAEVPGNLQSNITDVTTDNQCNGRSASLQCVESCRPYEGLLSDENLKRVVVQGFSNSPSVLSQVLVEEKHETSGRTFTDRVEKENTSKNRSLEKWETCSTPVINCSAELSNEDFRSRPSADAPLIVSENSMETFPCSSTQGNTSPREDSETSSEWDDDTLSDGSSSPTLGTPCRGRGSTTRRDGPYRQQGRGRVKPVEEEKLYDRLPSYYTLFSRPNRTATGIVRSSRSFMRLVMNSELQSHERDPSPEVCGFDKVPLYQSCFTNSTRFDEETKRCSDEGSFDLDDLDERSCCGRGHGTGSRYTHSRPRFRSRSRLRTTTNARLRQSDLTASVVDKRTNEDRRASMFLGPARDSLSQNSIQESNQDKLKQQHRRIVYIGRIPANLTAEQLKATFGQFGQIEKCTVHFRECGDNYGFVTYMEASGACKAVEGGNRLSGCANFDICFGGRRNFCRADYSDLDGNVEMEEELLMPVISKLKPKHDFDDLLMDELLKRRLQ